jgi:phosphomevalonate kinase
MIHVSAPGKVVLSGEYAVLRGAPAISAAIDRRAVVQVEHTDNNFNRISTPGYADGSWRFTANATGEIGWLDEPPAQGLRLIEEGWRAVAPIEPEGLSIIVDTSEFFAPASAEKLGLGSSAAAMTAFVGALCKLVSVTANVDKLSASAHLALQRGLGSGVDIATSFHGGVIEYRMGREQPPPHYGWPDGLDYRLLWSGKPADTMSKISKLDTAGGDDGRWASLVSAASEAATVWAGGNVAEILDVFGRYTEILRHFSIDQELGIFDAGHDGLKDMASSFDVVYKPCGAGGGDIGIVLASDNSAISRFCEQAESVGFQQLAIAQDPNGVIYSVGVQR